MKMPNFSKTGIFVITLVFGLGSGFLGGVEYSFSSILPFPSLKESMVWTAASSYVRGCQEISKRNNMKFFDECKEMSKAQIADTREILEKEPIREIQRRAKLSQDDTTK